MDSVITTDIDASGYSEDDRLLVADRLLDPRLLENGAMATAASDIASALREATGDFVTVKLPVDDGTPAGAKAWLTVHQVLSEAAADFRLTAPEGAALVFQLLRALGNADAHSGASPDPDFQPT